MKKNLLTTAVFVAFGATMLNAESVTVTTGEDLIAAAAAAEEGDVITVDGPVVVSPRVTVNGKTNVTFQGINGASITGNGNVAMKVNGQSTGILIKDIDFVDNNFSGDGIALGVDGQAVVTLENCGFYNNVSGSGKGILYMDQNCSVTLIDCTFENNTTNDQAVIYSNSDANTLTATGCAFLNNASTGEGAQGGLSYLRNTSGSFTDCLFIGNTSNNKGGVVYFGGGATNTVTFNRCAMLQNYAKNGGVVFYDHGGQMDLNFYNCTIAENSAASNGGTVYLNNSNAATNFNFYQCTMRDNTTEGNTGNCAGLFFVKVLSTVNIVNSIFENNLATNGSRSISDLASNNNAATINVENSVIDQYDVSESSTITVNEESVVNLSNQEDYDGNYAGLTLPIDEELNCYTVATEESKAATMGNLALNPADLTTDQLGQERTLPYIGAVQLLTGGSGISDAFVANQLSINGREISIHAQSTVQAQAYNLQGRLVATTNGTDMQLTMPTAGVYVVTVSDGRNMQSTKVLVK